MDQPHYVVCHLSICQSSSLLGFLGILASQTIFPDVAERDVLSALLLMQSGGALALQLFGIGSACFLFLTAGGIFIALSLDALLNPNIAVSLWTYALGLLVPLLTGTQMTYIVLDVFVPLVCPYLRVRTLCINQFIS